MVGEWLVANGIKIDLVYTSAHRRAIISAKHMLGKYTNKVPVHIMHQIHEVGGVYMKGKCEAGLTVKEIREIMPDIVIGEQRFDEKGWFLNEKPETL